MPKVTYRQHDGNETVVDVPVGTTVMQAALQAGLEGIEAECGGSCICATCHVYVEEAWFDRLPAIEESEDVLLDDTESERLPTSRLSCQIVIAAELDGLVVTMPEAQF